MDLKHSPEEAFEQIPRQHYLRRWRASPLGQRVGQLALAEIQRHCVLRYGDRVLQLAPVNLLPPAALDPAWVLRVAPADGDIWAETGFLPLAPESFSAILLLREGPARGDWDQPIAEATRVLAPEGHLFLLDLTLYRARLGRGWSSPRALLPAGMHRRYTRRQLLAAGLQIKHQRALTMLPGTLPSRWQQVLARADARLAPWLPAAASVVLTIARRRDALPLTGGRWRWTGFPARAANGSQWAWRQR